MKIAITASEKDENLMMDTRFGRCPMFVIYDTETKEVSYLDNEQNLNAAQGAGIQAAQNVVKNGVTAVITGHCGPKAFKVLSESGVTIYHVSKKSVREAITSYDSGTLVAAENADVEGHWV